MKHITFPYNFQNIKSIFHFPGTLDPPPNHHSRSSSSPIAADSADKSVESAGNNAAGQALSNKGGNALMVDSLPTYIILSWFF